MNEKEQEIVTLPGVSVTIRNAPQSDQTAGVAETAYTNVPPFEEIKHLLSDKPLHKPYRKPPGGSGQ